MITPQPAGVSDSATLYFVYDADDQFVRSFGSYNAREAGGRDEGLRFLSPMSDTTFWASHSNRPEVELWDVRGRHLKTLVLQLDWFEPWTTSNGILSREFEPRMGYASQDSGGRLWVTISVEDPDWEPPLRARAVAPEDLDPSDILDDIMLVIDLASRTVLAQRRFDMRVVQMGGAVYTTRMTDEGIYIIDVNRPRLAR